MKNIEELDGKFVVLREHCCEYYMIDTDGIVYHIPSWLNARRLSSQSSYGTIGFDGYDWYILPSESTSPARMAWVERMQGEEGACGIDRRKDFSMTMRKMVASQNANR